MLVGTPNARCQEFQQMAVGVAKIDALPTSRPGNVAQDLDSVGAGMGFPLGSCAASTAKPQWIGPEPSCGRDFSSGKFGT